MERRVWIVSAASAVLGAVLLQLHLRGLEQELAGGPRSRALVLARDLPARTTLTADMLGERELPRAYLESRHILARDRELVIGARLGVAGRATETLLWTDLAAVRDDARPLSSLVPESMRAVTLAQAAHGLEQLLDPGDRVDVVLVPDPAPGRSLSPSRVAENLLVLAIGSDLERAAGGARSSGRASGLITVGATFEQSLELAAAERAGSLRLLLRNPDEVGIAADPATALLSAAGPAEHPAPSEE
jgi:Flp pilus assembly protein CpaB